MLSAAGALLLLASCAVAGASPSPRPPTSQPASPTAAPPAATATAHPIPTTTLAPTATDYEQQAPPLGELTLPDGLVVPGFQGSWCYDRGCLDTIPPAKARLPRIETSSDSELTFTLAATHPFAYWRVDYGSKQDGPTTRLAEGGTYQDTDAAPTASVQELTSFTFDVPPAGDWWLTIHVQFPRDLGATVYYWHAVVD